MAYLIDGHNLIPTIPGLHLDDLDDEDQLIELLQAFCRQHRKRVEVYFDNAPPGQPRARKHGLVTAHYIRQGSTADQAIINRLRKIGRAAPNWTVVTSDRKVASAARESRARLISSQDFTRQLQAIHTPPMKNPETDPELSLGNDQVAEWMEIFKDEDQDP